MDSHIEAVPTTLHQIQDVKDSKVIRKMTPSSSRFRPTVKEYAGRHASILKWSLVLITITFLLISSSDTGMVQPKEGDDVNPIESSFSTSSNFIRVKLPYQVYSIAPGVIPIGSGFAYVHEDTIRFKDPVNQLNDSLYIGMGDTFYETLTGYDIDNDGYTEFLFIMFNSTIASERLIIADFDASSVTNYDCPVSGASEIIFGNFTPDGQTDVAIYNMDAIARIDLSDGSQIGAPYKPGTEIKRAVAGNFSATSEDEIAILSTNWGSGRVNIETIRGDGSPVLWIEYPSMSVASDMTLHSWRAESDDLAITVTNQDIGTSELVGIYGNNLTERFIKKIPEYFGDTFAKTGSFNDDSIDDLAVIPTMWHTAWFFDGETGMLIGHTEEQVSSYWRRGVAVSVLDSDAYTDLAVEGPRGQLTLIRGSNGKTGYEENRIPGPFYQVVSFDINEDGRDDIIALMDSVSILLSDTEIPNVSLDPLYPTHPTIYDTFMKVELTATDNIYVARATIYIKSTTGGVAAPFMANEMIRVQNDKFIYITTDLQAGEYQYYVKVVDAYLNTFSYGNETNPEILDVEDHFADGYFFNATIDHAMGHVLAEGNNTAGEDLIYVVTVETSSRTATLRAFAPNGTTISDFVIPNTSSSDSFEVYSGMHDGDSILDPVVVRSNYTHTVFYVFHGNDLTSWKNVTYKEIPILDERAISVFDDDNDGFDEVHYVQGNYSAPTIRRIEHDFSVSISDPLSDNGDVVGMAYATIEDTEPQIGLLRANNSVDIYQAYNLTLLKTLDYSSPGSTLGDNPLGIVPYNNATHTGEQFLVAYSSWSGDTPTIYLCLIDSQTLQVGSAPYTELLGDHIKGIYSYDVDKDDIDELFVFEESGNISLCELGETTPRQWSVFVSEAFPTSAITLDYNGDGAEEFIISTSDDMLTAISFQGTVEYQAKIGMIFNMVKVGNVDVGVGEDIAAFPIFRARYSLATIRDIDLLYILDTTFGIESSTTLQGSSVWANATVLNAYNEPVSDAVVSLTVEYEFGSGTTQQTLGLVYNEVLQLYTTNIAPNWPIGMVNMTLSGNHDYYDPFTQFHADALRVESPLTISIIREPELLQGNDLEVNITVSDSLGGKVSNADVTLTFDGTDYIANHVGQFYYIIIPSVTKAPGSYSLLVTANHSYATGIKTQVSSVSIYTNTLNIARSSPSQVTQDQYFAIWLNITDTYGNSISGADVRISFDGTEFILSEIELGKYQLNATAALPVGNYSARITVEHSYVEGRSFGGFYMAVIGDLYPVVNYESTVNAGQNFTVSIFVYDSYSAFPDGAWATVELDGSNFTAQYIVGAEFRVELNASLAIGHQSFIVYVGSDFSTPRSDYQDLYVYSRASMNLDSSIGWILNQGDSTFLTLTLADWDDNPVTGATVTMLHPSSLAFIDNFDGTYSVTLDTEGYSPGNYSLIVYADHPYLIEADLHTIITVNGQAAVDAEIPELVWNHQNVTMYFAIIDIYGNPLSDFNYALSFAGIYSKSGTSVLYGLSWEFLPDLYPGSYPLDIIIDGDFLAHYENTIWIDVRGSANSSILSPMNSSIISQGDQINFTVFVEDLSGYDISGCQVSVTIHGSSYTLNEGISGIYTRNIPTAGFPLGQYNPIIRVVHTYLDTQELSMIISLEGYADVKLSYSPFPVQNKIDVTFNFTVTDQYGNPLSGFNYSLDFAGVYNQTGTASSYRLSWTVDPSFTPGKYFLNMTLNGTYLLHSVFSFSIDVQGVVSASILTPTDYAAFSQGDPIQFTVHVQDELFFNITGADVELDLLGSTFALTETSPGIYIVTISTTQLSLGEYTAKITASQGFMDTYTAYVHFSIIGSAHIAVITNPTVVLNYENVTFDISVLDQWGNPIYVFDYTFDFGGVCNVSGTSTSSLKSWQLLPDVVPGAYALNVTVSGAHFPTETLIVDVYVRSDTIASVLSPLNNSQYVQGTDDILFTLNLEDMLGNVMIGGDVSVLIHDSFYILSDLGNGTYSIVVSTDGWAAGLYNYTLMVAHGFLSQDATIRGSVEIFADLVFGIEYSPKEPVKGEYVNITIEVTDTYGNPMSGLSVYVTFRNHTEMATETAQKGTYFTRFVVAGEGFGDSTIDVGAEGVRCNPGVGSVNAYVVVPAPQLTMDPQSFGFLALGSFLISFLGLLMYFKISSGLSITSGSQEQLIRGLRRLDYLYLGVVGLAALTVSHSYVSAAAGNYDLAVLESVLLLGISLILYGIWLYRDATSTILQSQAVSRRRMFLGLWHLIFVPFVIMQLFDWGRHIEWLNFYVLRNVFHLGELELPSIMLTIFAAYISSIVIVVVNLYREISKGLSRINEMAVLGTPPIVVEQECVDLVEKLGSSIRTKFFMFLVVLAGTSVLTMDFLKSYSLGVIVLMPVVFLVFVPYVSSKMAKGITRVSSSRRERHTDDKTLVEIADGTVDSDTSFDAKPYYDSEKEIKPSEIEIPPLEEETEEEQIEESLELQKLTKKELIERLPEKVKESIGLDELKKLSKDQLKALVQLEEIGLESSDDKESK
ncbi:MAG: hypothetical protein EAX87_07305 [Candidatus Thorarchaeota archaeon]|nr:hypothetical protein [Candidatus Thorarchaeota archaeon]